VTHPLVLNCMHLVVENGNAFLSINGCQTALIMAKAKLYKSFKSKKDKYFVIRWVTSC
jgi:hypothetical protein